jgi:hypothetical protein
MSGRRGRRIRKSLQRAAIIRLPPAKNEHPTMFSCFDIRIAEDWLYMAAINPNETIIFYPCTSIPMR